MGSLPLGTVAVAVCVLAGYGAVAGVTLLRSGRPVVHRTPGTLQSLFTGLVKITVVSPMQIFYFLYPKLSFLFFTICFFDGMHSLVAS